MLGSRLLFILCFCALGTGARSHDSSDGLQRRAIEDTEAQVIGSSVLLRLLDLMDDKNRRRDEAQAAELRTLKKEVAELRTLKNELKVLRGQLKDRSDELADDRKSLNVLREALFSSSAPFRNHTYHFAEYLPQTNFKATAVCEAMGGYLAEINDRDEYNFILKFSAPHMNPRNMVRIGGSDSINEGQWMYHRTHAPVSFFDWWPGEPQVGPFQAEDCLHLLKQNEVIHILDYECEYCKNRKAPWHHGFICEVPQ